jgi:broad specificity phosphatase PhoE
MSLILHFLRHGQTALSRDNVFCGSGLNPDLTPEGHAMAAAFAAAYHSTPWNAIYASPLQRAIATAHPLCEITGIALEQRTELVEIGYGRWEGLNVESVSRDFHDDHLRWTADPAWNAPTEGETAIAIAQRGLQVVAEIKQRYTDGNVLIVSHKATIRVIICALLGIDVGRFRFRLGCPVGSVSTIEFTTYGPLLHTLADRSHLDANLRSLPGT